MGLDGLGPKQGARDDVIMLHLAMLARSGRPSPSLARASGPSRDGHRRTLQDVGEDAPRPGPRRAVSTTVKAGHLAWSLAKGNDKHLWKAPCPGGTRRAIKLPKTDCRAAGTEWARRRGGREESGHGSRFADDALSPRVKMKGCTDANNSLTAKFDKSTFTTRTPSKTQSPGAFGRTFNRPLL